MLHINIDCSCSLCAGSPFKLDAQLGPDPSKCAMGGPALQANAILQVGVAAATASSTVPLPLLFHVHCPLGMLGRICLLLPLGDSPRLAQLVL